jgi:predicted small secreted protein
MFFKRGLFLTVIALMVVTAQGCGETIKGASKDMRNMGSSIQKADAWLTEKLW